MQQTLEKLFSEELADLYDAEQQILKALPKMIDAASSSELQDALQQHRSVTERQVQRLDQIFREMGGRPEKRCKGMAGLIAEGEDLLKEDFDGHVKDAGIIGAAQKVEHYEIAGYGTARTFAEFLGNEKAVQLLQETLDEEKEADEQLTQIAESSINVEAATESGEEMEMEGDGAPRRSETKGEKRRSSAKSKR